jgi:TetR/AcrR family transcriptional regulator
MKTPLKVRALRQGRNDARAARIMEAAARVFARKGVENTTMENIAREAKVAVGTIYLHFASRDELYLNLRADRSELLGDGYRAVKASGLAPIDELRTLARVYVDYLRDSADPILISEPTPLYEIKKRLRRSSETRAFERDLNTSREVFHLFEDSVRKAFEAGLIADPLGPTGVTVAIWSILNGAFMVTRDHEFIVHTTGMDPAGFIANALDSYLNAIAFAARAGLRPLMRAHRNDQVRELPKRRKAL